MDWASHCWEAGGGRQDSLTSGLCIDSSKGDYMMIAHLKYQTAQILNVTLHAGWRYRQPVADFHGIGQLASLRSLV